MPVELVLSLKEGGGVGSHHVGGSNGDATYL